MGALMFPAEGAAAMYEGKNDSDICCECSRANCRNIIFNYLQVHLLKYFYTGSDGKGQLYAQVKSGSICFSEILPCQSCFRNTGILYVYHPLNNHASHTDHLSPIIVSACFEGSCDVLALITIWRFAVQLVSKPFFKHIYAHFIQSVIYSQIFIYS